MGKEQGWQSRLLQKYVSVFHLEKALFPLQRGELLHQTVKARKHCVKKSSKAMSGKRGPRGNGYEKKDLNNDYFHNVRISTYVWLCYL